MSSPLYRVWINQPSADQRYHKLHGKVGIAATDIAGRITTIYFTEGPVHSMRIHKNVLVRVPL